MAQPTFADILVSITAWQKPANDAGGALKGPINVEERFADGTGTRQYEAVIFDERTLAASATFDLDLQVAVDVHGIAAALVDVRAFVVIADAANGADVRVTPASSNGWTPLISSSGATDDPQLDVAAGMSSIHIAPVDGSLPVSGSDKSLTFTNLDGAASVTYTVLVIGPRS